MRLAGSGAQTANRFNGCFGQFKARIGMVETEEVNPVMRFGELTIGLKERRVACHGLVKQLHSLEQIFFCPRAKGNAVDEVFGSQVEIVGNKVPGRWLLDGGFLDS